MENNLLIQILRTAVAAFIPIVVLIFTLWSNRKSQEKNNNIQNSFLIKESFLKEIDRTKQIITEAYNQLEELLFVTHNLKPRNMDIESYIDKLNKNYVLFRQSINGIKFTTRIYQSRKWCEGCTLCEIKIQGDLAKALTKLQEIIFAIDSEVTYAFSLLIEALDGLADSHKSIKTMQKNKELSDSYKSLIKSLENLQYGPYDEAEKNRLSHEIVEKSTAKMEIDREIERVEKQLDVDGKNIGEKNLQARTKIIEVITKYKPQLDSAISDYFFIFNEYARQYSEHIRNGGTLNRHCKKYGDYKTVKKR